MAQYLLTRLSLHSDGIPPFTLRQGVIRHKGRVWLSGNVPLQEKVIKALHDTSIGGHSGAPATYSKIKQLFYWTGMKSAIYDYVQSCSIFQQAKADRARYPGLLQPLAVPTQAWHTVSLDFIEGLPRSAHANCILVVIDMFSKYSHFIPLLYPFTAPKVAQFFLDQVYRLHTGCQPI
jgi:hypothetical protein